MTPGSETFRRRALAAAARTFVPQTFIVLFTATIIVASLGSPARSAAASTINGPPSTYDMLDWMTLASDLRATYHLEGTSSPLYTNLASRKESLRQIVRAFEALPRLP